MEKMAPEHAQANPSPGARSLILVIVTTLLVAAILAGLGWLCRVEWAQGACVGWCLAGLLGVGGWWSVRKALAAGERMFTLVVFGGMGARLLLCGVFAAVVVGTRWLDPIGFVVGLLAGVCVFTAMEIGIVTFVARRNSAQAGRIARSTEG